jgi:hypothetical protein
MLMHAMARKSILLILLFFLDFKLMKIVEMDRPCAGVSQ